MCWEWDATGSVLLYAELVWCALCCCCCCVICVRCQSGEFVVGTTVPDFSSDGDSYFGSLDSLGYYSVGAQNAYSVTFAAGLSWPTVPMYLYVAAAIENTASF